MNNVPQKKAPCRRPRLQAARNWCCSDKLCQAGTSNPDFIVVFGLVKKPGSKHDHPNHEYGNVDPFPNADERRRFICRNIRGLKRGEYTKKELQAHRGYGVSPEPPSKGRRSTAHDDQHQYYRDHCPSYVQLVGQGWYYSTLMHGGPVNIENSIGNPNEPRHSQEFFAMRDLNHTPPKGSEEHWVNYSQPDPQPSGGSSDGRKLTDRLCYRAIIWVQHRYENIEEDVPQRRRDAAIDQSSL